MTTALKLTMTTAGLGRFTAAQVENDIDLTIAHVAFTAQSFVTAPTLTALPGEFRRVATVSGQPVGDNIVHMIVRDADPLTYTVTGFGLFLGDGTLFAVYGQDAPIVEKAVDATLLLALDIAFPTADVDRLTFGDTNFLDPPATTQTAGVILLADQPTVDAGLDQLRAVTPMTLAERLAALSNTVTGLIAAAIATCIPLAQRAAANGVATLDDAGVVPLAQIPSQGLVPTGTITLFYGAAAPAGWAICNGQTVARADGTGNITTPDLRGRVAVGASDDYALGSAFGATLSKFTTIEAGGHAHGVGTLAAASANATTGVTIQYSTSSSYAGGGTQTAVAAGNNGNAPSLTDPGHAHDVAISGSTAAVPDHTHDVTIDTTQPSFALNYIMRL